MGSTFAIMAITLCGVGCLLWGAHTVTPSAKPLSRAPWFLFRRVSDLIVMVVVLGALKNGQFSVDIGSQVAITVVLCLIVSPYGYLLGVGSARRSLSIRGDTVMALLAVVPVFNLYLLFTAPKTPDEDDVNWLYIAGGMVALLLTYALYSQITDSFQASSNVTAFPP